LCTNAGNCYACTRSKKKIDHPNGEEHFGGHPHQTGESETEDDRICPTLIDVDYRFFDPDRDIDLVKWFADRIDCAKAVACLKSRSAEDDSDDEDDQDDEDETEKDFSIFCRRCV
jgi:chorismate mutase